jgi:hypothetical protein
VKRFVIEPLRFDVWVKQFAYCQQDPGSNTLWTLLFALGTLRHDGRAEATPEVIGQLVELRVPIDLDRFAGGIADDVAVVAPSQMIFQFRLGALIDSAIEVVG